MEVEKAAGLIVLGWLIFAFVLMVRSIRKGQRLADTLAMRHPETYEALGRPRPGYFDSVQRARFARFVGRREFEKLGDLELSAQFEEYRRSEARLLLLLLASLAAVALLAFALQHST